MADPKTIIREINKSLKDKADKSDVTNLSKLVLTFFGNGNRGKQALRKYADPQKLHISGLFGAYLDKRTQSYNIRDKLFSFFSCFSPYQAEMRTQYLQELSENLHAISKSKDPAQSEIDACFELIKTGVTRFSPRSLESESSLAYHLRWLRAELKSLDIRPSVNTKSPSKKG